MSHMMAWMVPLCLRGSSPIDATSSEQVAGPLLMRAERTLARMMEASMSLVGDEQSNNNTGETPANGSNLKIIYAYNRVA